MREATDDECDRADRLTPDVTVATGLTSDEGATELELFYLDGKTTVVWPCGEEQNADAFAYDSIVSGEAAVELYKQALNDAG